MAGLRSILLFGFIGCVAGQVQINDLGCWKDDSKRAIPGVDKKLEKKFGPYTSRTGAVQICAEYAKSRGYDVFAVQNGGWCATSKSARSTYQKYGPSTTCKSDGEGGPWGNQVYEIAAPPTKVEYGSLGCYKDTSDRAVQQADGRFSSLRDNYKKRAEAIEKCALVALSMGAKVFAVQDGGWCATGPYAHLAYAKYGKSTACNKNGKGGPFANNVYSVGGWTPEALIPTVDLGCWKDTGKRAIPGTDSQLQKQYGPYKSRIGAVQRCAQYAKSKKYTVFAVQDGGWCATSKNAAQTYNKYGPSGECKSDGEGGPYANQVYRIGEEVSTSIEYTSLGCYKDAGERAVTQADGRFSSLRDPYKSREEAISKCAAVAQTIGAKVFAVQDGGWCATGAEAHLTYSKYGASTDCGKDGKGGPWANNVYSVGGWTPEELIPTIDLGCWKDAEKRAIAGADSQLQKQYGPYKDRAGAIQRCAQYAKSKNHEVFAVQDGGWCATSKSAATSFNKYGESSACKPDGKGGPFANQVYRIGKSASSVAYTPLGCYKDTGERAIPQADGRYSSLRDNYQDRDKAIAKCASVASRHGYKVFAIQNGGWCATGPTAHFSFAKYGQSVACKTDGKGGPWANAVYSLGKWQPVPVNDLGCWKDTEKRAIGGVDKALEKEFGPYQDRDNAVQICAQYAKSKGYDVFAVQNGGWCATSKKARNQFRKYGPSTACKPDGEGGPWGNQVYEIGSSPTRVKFSSIGCYADKGKRAIPQADQFFSTLRDSYKLRINAISKCASVAASLGYKVFAVQDGGWCATGPNAHLTFDQYGTSKACVGEGKGGPYANHVYTVNDWKMTAFYDLGCWQDQSKRAIASADKPLEKNFGPYKSREGAIRACAEYAQSQGNTVFAIQDGGWCATSRKAKETFDKYGPSLSCAADGKGGPFANQVYEIGRHTSEFEFSYVGCFQDKGDRAIPQADGRFSTLRDPYKKRENAILKCAQVAASLGYMIFAIQDGGWCATGAEAHLTFDKYGMSSKCGDDGKGGPWANAVYTLEEPTTDYCLSAPCVRGECLSKKEGFECICPPTHSGTTCNEEINFCESTPCVHGECVMKAGGFECVCYKGFRGEICSEIINLCEPDPCAAGRCVPTIGDFACACPAGRYGKLCENVNVCEPNPCYNGKCKTKNGGYECICDDGFTGENCNEVSIVGPCSSFPCMNGGTCISVKSKYWCFCATGFKGENCDESEVWNVYSPCTRSCGGGSRYKVVKCDENDITKCPRVYEGCNYRPCNPNPTCARIGYEYKYKTLSECCQVTDDDEVCGVSALRSVSQRVIGGYIADLGNWPWAALLHIKSSSTTNSTCGGTLIHAKWILTAAHCFKYTEPEDITVYLGTTNPALNQLSMQALEVEKIIIHEDFSFPRDDIALLKLKFHASITQLVRPLCLPMGERVQADVKCFVAGWGVAKVEDIARGIPADDLMEVAVMHLDFDVCKSGYYGASVHKYLNPKMLCAGSIDGGVDTCLGDSGGPLMCQRCDSCSWFVAGVTSFGSAYCGEAGRPGIYTNVLLYEDWIKSYVPIEDSKTPSCA